MGQPLAGFAHEPHHLPGILFIHPSCGDFSSFHLVQDGIIGVRAPRCLRKRDFSQGNYPEGAQSIDPIRIEHALLGKRQSAAHRSNTA